MWNPKFGSDFIQDELFSPIFTQMPNTSAKNDQDGKSDQDLKSQQITGEANFLSGEVVKKASIRGRERELRERLPEFRVIRSSRRKRSIQALRQNGVIEIHIPDRISRREELELIPEMIQMVLNREAKNRKSDSELAKWAKEILAQLLPDFDPALEAPKSVAWRAMQERWGSCTTVDKTIRISERLNNAPQYVIKHVLFHELIHLRIADHGEEFARLLSRNPDGARAESFLEGFELGSSGNSDIYL